MTPEINEIKKTMMKAVEAYRQAMDQAAAMCVSFRDKHEHYRFKEATAGEIEAVLNSINDHADEAELCNTSCPRYRVGDCPYRQREDCPRYTDLLSEAEI